MNQDTTEITVRIAKCS